MKRNRPVKGEREQREFSLTEARANEAGTISGHAAVFNQPAMIWDFEEQVAPGAFKRTLDNQAPVFALFNHDPNLVLAGTKNQSLRLKEDEHGLGFDFDPVNTQAGRDTRTLVEVGLVSKASFGFEVVVEEWEQREGQPDLRTIKEAKLFDVSPVVFPAYEGTDVQANSAQAVVELRDTLKRVVQQMETRIDQNAQEPEPSPRPAPHLEQDDGLLKIKQRMRELDFKERE